MNHPDKDKILKYVLDVLDTDEIQSVTKHLEECEACRSELRKVKEEVDTISKFDPVIELEPSPVLKIKKSVFIRILKVAAILVIGFFSGYLASETMRSKPVNVVEQHLIVKAPETSIIKYIPASVVDIFVYY